MRWSLWCWPAVLGCCSWLLFLAGCSCVFLGLLACRGPLVFCSLSPIQSLKTISVFFRFIFLRSVFLRHVFLRYTFSYVTRFLTLHVFLRCVASAYTMNFRGHSTSVVLRVCFIQQLIQDGIIIAKQCPTAVQIADIGTALPRVPFKSFSDQLLGDKHVGDY